MEETVEWKEIGELAKAHLSAFGRAIDYSTYLPSKELLEQVTRVIEKEGKWAAQEEWRISTWMFSKIVKNPDEGDFTVAVECDGQRFQCECPVLWRAVFFAQLYSHLIVQSFYCFGGPWEKRP